MKKILIVAVLLIVTFLVGFWLGGGVKMPSSSTEFDRSKEADLRDKSRERRRIKTRADSDNQGEPKTAGGRVIDNLERFMSMSSGELETSARSLNELPLEQRAWKSVAIFAAWAEIDPEAALMEAMSLDALKDDMIALVLSSWREHSSIEAATFYKKNEQLLFTRNYDRPWEQVSGSAVIAEALLTDTSFAEAMLWAQGLNQLDAHYTTKIIRSAQVIHS